MKIKSTIEKIIKYLVWGFLGILFSIVIIQRIKGETPSLFGKTIFVIVTDSMETVYDVGDVILVEKVDPSEIKKGDDITYYGKTGSYKDKVITHRVVEDPVFENGVYTFQTQGIKAGANLDPKITDKDVIGKVESKLIVITFIYKLVTNIYGFILIIVLPISIMLGTYIYQTFKKDDEKEKEERKNEEIAKYINDYLEKHKDDIKNE